MAHIDSTTSTASRCRHRAAGTCPLPPIESERMTIAIGCDLGGTHLSVAVAQDRSLLSVRDAPVESKRGLKALLPLIETTIRELLASSALQPSDCSGLVLALPS